MSEEIASAMVIHELREALKQAVERAERAEADYAMLRAVARRCFAENTTDQDMLDLWNLAATIEHPGAALIIRYNKAQAELTTLREIAQIAHDYVNAAHGSYDLERVYDVLEVAVRRWKAEGKE